MFDVRAQQNQNNHPIPGCVSLQHLQHLSVLRGDMLQVRWLLLVVLLWCLHSDGVQGQDLQPMNQATPAEVGNVMSNVAVTPLQIARFLPRWGFSADISTATGSPTNLSYANGILAQAAYGARLGIGVVFLWWQVFDFFSCLLSGSAEDDEGKGGGEGKVYPPSDWFNRLALCGHVHL
jgi:hypothetical protein